MILVVVSCDVCNGIAGIGMTVEHAESNAVLAGGRIIADLLVCEGCAEHTR